MERNTKVMCENCARSNAIVDSGQGPRCFCYISRSAVWCDGVCDDHIDFEDKSECPTDET